MITTLAAFGTVGGCSSNDACEGLGTCLALTAMPAGGAPINIDQLIVTVSGQVNGTRTLPTMPHAVTLPQTVALEFNPPNNYMGPFGFSVAVVGQKAGITVASGQGSTTMTTGRHQLLTVSMAVGGGPMPVGPDMAQGPPLPTVDMASSD
jgi:hypothetical protein